MKLVNVIKSEFIKNYTFKKLLLIVLILLVTIIGLTEINNLTYKNQEYPIQSELSNAKLEYESYNGGESKVSLKEEYYFKSAENRIAMLEKMKQIGKIIQNSWQFNVLFDIFTLQSDNVAIKQLLNFDNKEQLSKICNYDGVQYDEYDGRIKMYCNKSIKELISIQNENSNKINIQEELIEDNKYYKYVEYLLNNNKISEDSKKSFQQIIKEEIADENDYRVRNLYQRNQILSNSFLEIKKKTDFNKDSYMYTDYKDYNGYVRFNIDLKKSIEEKIAIINYSIENQIKHDITFNNYDLVESNEIYMTSKVAVNQIFNLSIVVILLVIITSGGIVSNEHIKGTDKMLLTSPIKRWKILLGKFIYLIIHCYIIWFIALLLLSLYAGIRFSFNDLFSAKLIYEGGKVVEVNYYINLIKNMFVASIPIISFISIMFALSTITLKTSLTIGISTIITCLSPTLWYIISTYKLWFISYTPFPYLDYGLVLNKYEHYSEVLKQLSINSYTGIIISLITIVILVSTSTIIYIKRDIKN